MYSPCLEEDRELNLPVHCVKSVVGWMYLPCLEEEWELNLPAHLVEGKMIRIKFIRREGKR